VLALRTVLSDIDDSPLPDVHESVGVGAAWMVLAAVAGAARRKGAPAWAAAVDEAKEYFREAARGEDDHG
jgi:hypothetical protein